MLLDGANVGCSPAAKSNNCEDSNGCDRSRSESLHLASLRNECIASLQPSTSAGLDEHLFEQQCGWCKPLDSSQSVPFDFAVEDSHSPGFGKAPEPGRTYGGVSYVKTNSKFQIKLELSSPGSSGVGIGCVLRFIRIRCAVSMTTTPALSYRSNFEKSCACHTRM